MTSDNTVWVSPPDDDDLPPLPSPDRARLDRMGDTTMADIERAIRRDSDRLRGKHGTTDTGGPSPA